jgi:glycolate oxidase FAD binding subunit
MDPELLKLRERVLAARAARASLQLRGAGTKDFYGQALEGEILDTRAWAGIVSYEPSELVITARCGTGLAEVEAAMRERGQLLAFEPPHFGEATLGGAVAAGLSGPGRQSAGALRDFVLGARIMDGRGEVLSFGGQVMKNVAGYDVSRLMAGSLGTLGIVLEVSLKALPLPVAETTLRLELPENRAIEQLNRWAGKPLPISASAWNEGTLSVRLSGALAAVKAARGRIGGEPVEEAKAQRFWNGVREHTDRFFRSDAPLWRLSLPSTAQALGLQGEQLIEWGGALRWLHSQADARTVRDAVRRAGGHATLFRGGDKADGVFSPLAPALMKIHRDLKREFDPQGVFNRGRMYPDL